ncbi:MAG: hypothetical protein AAB586_01620 [Patescibacteria group bacterium]
MNGSRDINIVPASIVVAGLIVAGAVLYQQPLKSTTATGKQTASADKAALIVSWDDMGVQLVRAGVIDSEKFKAIYEGRGQFTNEYANLLFGEDDGQLEINKDNAGFVLNLLWALGLGNKSPVLEDGEMANPKYGGPQNFASTAGWTMAKGDVMDHYNAHRFINLTAEQEKSVARVAQSIYRPCCGNSAYFPDCNHGMAMLGFLELTASQGATEKEMYNSALVLNSFWFPGYEPGEKQGGGCNV